MKQFKFEGDWEFEYQFEAFKGLQSRRGAYTSQNSKGESDGVVQVIIEDELNDETDPKPEQINAINYILNNPDAIKETLFKTLDGEYPNLKKMYDYHPDDEDAKEWFPEITNLSDFKNVFGVGNVFILLPEKDGYAYVGLECGCTWDEEHGLGFLLHKDRVVKIGGADEAFRSWEAYKDNGTFEEKQKEFNDQHSQGKLLPKPKIYEPHPKYNKLKPTQIDANRMYENHLIERGYNQEFINLVEAGEVDINVNKGLSMTFLERAAQFNNEEIVKYIIGKKPNITKGAIHMLSGHGNKGLIDFLVGNGVDINEPDHWGRTILSIVKQNIASLKNNSAGSVPGAEDFPRQIKELEDFAYWLEGRGAKL